MEQKTVKLKALLLILLISVVVVPIIVLFWGNSIISKNIFSSPEYADISSGVKLVESLSEEIANNYSHINDYDTFSEIIDPFLKDGLGRVIVYDLNNTVLYDSVHKDIGSLGLKSQDYVQDNTISFSVSLYAISTTIFSNINTRSVLNSQEEFKFWFPYNFNIKTNNQNVAKGTLFINYGAASTILVRKVMSQGKYVVWSTLLSLILMVWLLSRTIDRKILYPLAELNQAACKMAEEDYNHPITFHSKNEMGEFCNQFQDMRKQLAESRQKLDEDATARKLLIGNIAHDLRTPITSIKGYVEGLIDQVAVNQADRERYYQVIKEKTENLDFMINDLFTFSQLELGQLKINCRPVDSSDLLQPLLKSTQKVNIVLDNAAGSQMLNIDINQINRVIRNILENSIKFGASTIKISTKVIDKYLQINIADDGIGIDADIIDKVFDRFFTFVPKEANKAGGAGMGLAICQEIISLHGGEISIASEQGESTTVSIKLPLMNT